MGRKHLLFSVAIVALLIDGKSIAQPSKEVDPQNFVVGIIGDLRESPSKRGITS